MLVDDDVEATVKTLRSKGVEIITEPQEAPCEPGAHGRGVSRQRGQPHGDRQQVRQISRVIFCSDDAEGEASVALMVSPEPAEGVEPRGRQEIGCSNALPFIAEKGSILGMPWRVELFSAEVQALLDALPRDIRASFERIVRASGKISHGLEQMREPYVKHTWKGPGVGDANEGQGQDCPRRLSHRNRTQGGGRSRLSKKDAEDTKR